MVRRLPVIQSTPKDERESRPVWRWVALGAGLALSLWTALTAVVVPAVSHFVPSAPSDSVGPSGPALLWPAASAALGFALSVGVAAFLVSRYGPRQRGLGVRVGGAAAAVSWALAMTLGAARDATVQILALVVLVVLGGVSGFAAGRLGAKSGEVASHGGGS